MREICIKTNVSENHKRKNLSITEMIDQKGFVARAEKKFAYYVSEQNSTLSADKLKFLTEESLKNDFHKKDRHVNIKKILNPKTGVGQMIYRVTGSFYVVQDVHVFVVVFMHSVKFDMLSQHVSQQGQLPLL